MKFDLLDNGIDSLKAAGEILLDFYQDHEFERHQIKDAVFHLMHSVEIISKYILMEKNEQLIFSDVQEYLKAKETIGIHGFSNIFEANPDIKTINLKSALMRLKNNTKFPIEDKLITSINQIRVFRNQLMHYTVNLDDDEFLELVNILRQTYEQILKLFGENVKSFKEKFESVIREDPITEYEEYMERLGDLGLMAAEAAREDAYAEYMEQLMENDIHNK
jgi:uncharacterized protein YutE (UPF0331/DUF86 family)